jgi:hypothetical protein
MLDHQRDLWADFRAFYHLSPAEARALPGPEYMALAWRTPAYSGAMAARLARELEGQPASSGAGWSAPSTTRDVPLGSAATTAPDADGLPLSDLFDIG